MRRERPIRIGTRGSPLALAQSGQVRDGLVAAHPELAGAGAVEIVPISTRGDRVQDRRLSEIGNKGLFVKEIEGALADGRIDLAVHSLKDMETVVDPRFVLGAILQREDPRDALVATGCGAIEDLPPGATVGTVSLRRQSQVLALRPDLKVVPLRGNVGTRLRRVDEREIGATILALAGLKRLGLADRASAVLPTETMLPAVAQGAIAVECRADDGDLLDLLADLDHAPTRAAVAAERALLGALDGSCRTPVAALADIAGDELTLRALLARPDGTRVWRCERRGPVADAKAMGEDAGRELRAAGDRELFD
ncbi:MAG: hydroxymethylbilane synthase [Alphaproteobacteria bacterium]